VVRGDGMSRQSNADIVVLGIGCENITVYAAAARIAETEESLLRKVSAGPWFTITLRLLRTRYC